jgi:hypothetical protein
VGVPGEDDGPGCSSKSVRQADGLVHGAGCVSYEGWLFGVRERALQVDDQQGGAVQGPMQSRRVAVTSERMGFGLCQHGTGRGVACS